MTNRPVGTKRTTDRQDGTPSPRGNGYTFSAIPSPHTLRDTGLSRGLLEDLILKGMYSLGRITPMRLVRDLKLPFTVLEGVLRRLKAEGLCEVKGSQGLGEQLFEYALTHRGRGKASEALISNRYYGPAPVPLSQYLSVVHTQHIENGLPLVDREALNNGLRHMVVTDEMLESLGVAVNSGEAIVFHGASGNGKTSLALALGRVVTELDSIWIPYVVDVDGLLIQVFDPLLHLPVDGELPNGGFFAESGENGGYDRRWVRIKRPLVVGGGEVTLTDFELVSDGAKGVYSAPLQWKANGGTLVIDDFGRQTVPPRALLDRWIVPLEEHKDYLTLETGQKIELPLQVRLIIATNQRLDELADEAQLRRLRYRIPVPNPSPEQYDGIFRMACDAAGLAYDQIAVNSLTQKWYEGHDIEMRACHPRDLVAHLLDISRFTSVEPVLTSDLLDRAARFRFNRSSPDGD